MRATEARVKEQLDKHIREGHITSVTEPTPWISNMVVIAKPDKFRICIDPKHLNQALQRSHYHMPTLEDCTNDQKLVCLRWWTFWMPFYTADWTMRAV